MNSPEKRNILLMGYDSNIGLGMLYCLRELKANLFLFTHNRHSALKHSRFIKDVYTYNTTDADILDRLIKIIVDKKIDFVYPYDEQEVKLVTQNKDLLETYTRVSWGTAVATYEMAINKAGLSQFLEQNNIPKPRTVLLNDQVALDKLIQEFGFPLVIKKSRGSAGRMMQLIQDSQALSECLKSLDLNGFLAQPFIIGSDITCNVICREGEVICSTIQESPVKYGANFSSNDILEFKRDETVLNLVSRLMKGLRWNGVACIDMRRDQRDGKVYVLEINGRFWASVLSSYTKAGLNFPLILYKLATGSEDFQIPSPKPAHQISFKQYVQQKFRGKKVKFRDTKFITYLADPYARLNQILENKLFKHSSRLTEEEIS